MGAEGWGMRKLQVPRLCVCLGCARMLPAIYPGAFSL